MHFGVTDSPNRYPFLSRVHTENGSASVTKTMGILRYARISEGEARNERSAKKEKGWSLLLLR